MSSPTPPPPPPGPDDAVDPPSIGHPSPAMSAGACDTAEDSDATGNCGGASNDQVDKGLASEPDKGPVKDVVSEGVGTATTVGVASGSEAPVRPLIPALSVGTTVIHLVMTLVGVAVDADGFRNGVALVSVALFFFGGVSFMVAFVLAAGRSRYEDLWFGGVFFLTGGVVPARLRAVMMGCLGLQCVIGLAGASAAPFTPVAFVVLVPLAGMGLMSLYGARWGEFSPKREQD